MRYIHIGLAWFVNGGPCANSELVMGASTGIVLTGTAISAANDWYQTNQIPWSVGVAGLLLSGFVYGVEKLSQPLAVGLSSIFLITVLVTPIKGKNSPAAELAGLVTTGKLK